MKYNDAFNELIKNPLNENQYIGLGNPNAKILFIGKEAGLPKDSENIPGNIRSWRENNNDFSKRFTPLQGSGSEKNNLRNNNHTWQKYQKLYNLILTKLNIANTEPKKILMKLVLLKTFLQLS